MGYKMFSHKLSLDFLEGGDFLVYQASLSADLFPCAVSYHSDPGPNRHSSKLIPNKGECLNSIVLHSGYKTSI